MRILIIALARSGGYQLNEWLALELGYKMIHEPIRTNQSVEGDNIVVKYLINEIEDRTDIDYINWDKIIGLTTAAFIWAIAAIGILCGMGGIIVPIVLTVGLLAMSYVFEKVENAIKKKQ